MVAGGGGGFSLYDNCSPNNQNKCNAGGITGEDGFLLEHGYYDLVTTTAKGATKNKGGEGGVSPEDRNDPVFNLSEDRKNIW